MLLRISAILLLLSATATQGADQQPPEPDSLWNWLKIIDVESYRLLHASDQNGFYFAVKIDAEGDILFCYHDQSRATKAGPVAIHITDPKSGLDLKDTASKKVSPGTVTYTYIREIPDGAVRIQTATNLTYPLGTLYPITDRDIGAVHITFTQQNERGQKTVYFDQVVQLPKKAKPKAN